MKWLAITQRVDINPHYQERRDALDQRWGALLFEAGFNMLLLPNMPQQALALLCALPVQGIILSGGNTLQALGGDAPERDQTERAVFHYALQHQLPVLGVCRGMQFIQDYFGQVLQPLSGHICAEQQIITDEGSRTVNSYHQFGTTECPPPLIASAHSSDGVIKAVHHQSLPVQGIMWHPERIPGFSISDINLLKRFFS
ncbi:glutamine amidotransferase [Alishewanella longhuensis]|uniref:Glutamine amidotransferase n=1 Tax=Alishewanella longhuensis TaxID=1091037 RepID=A0ABQ3KXZ4_9ALTE|nr:gamma-glutamyl-gamma-aminobutyrate hydrolase family protein [Alishewanella longhuensis]GHG69351.1 glutamine amidotransferase [Alishewanella longhuensis]